MFKGIRISAAALVLAAGLAGVSYAQAVQPGFNSNTLGPTDDGSKAASIGFNVNFFGTTYNQLHVNNNGNITFGYADSAYTPYNLSTPTGVPMIAPFFADVDTVVSGSGIATYGTGTVNGDAAFGVTWTNVGYYGESNATNQSNTFQVLLIDRPDLGAGDFDIEFNYDKIQWETGSFSGGTNGLGGISAVAGYTDGTGNSANYYQLPGSGINGSLLDGGPDSLTSDSNYGVAGSYIFTMNNSDGSPFDDLPVSVPQPAPFGSALALFTAVLVYKLIRRKSQRV